MVQKWSSKVTHVPQIINKASQLAGIPVKQPKNNHNSLFYVHLWGQKDLSAWLCECTRGEESPAVRNGVSMCVHWVMKSCHSSLLSQSSSGVAAGERFCRGFKRCTAGFRHSHVLSGTLWYITYTLENIQKTGGQQTDVTDRVHRQAETYKEVTGRNWFLKGWQK